MSNNLFGNLEGKDGVEFIAKLSKSMRKDSTQQYTTLGVVLATYPRLDTERVIGWLKEWGMWD